MHQAIKAMHLGWLGLVTCLGVAGLGSPCLRADENGSPRRRPIAFSRDVRPILSNNCFQCHGPDEAERQADLRLDVAGELDLDEVLRRITSSDADLQMPPPNAHKELSQEQIAVLQEWLAAGAEYEQHWAFVPPRLVEPLLAMDHSWSEHPLDGFVLDRLNEVGLAPSPPADKRTLLRRLTLDLTGLPPTPEEIAAFVADESPQAYDNLVERLLGSPHFGEHVGRYWLDVVRFADTNGLHHDHYREMTPYRDWVIRAFNDNLPFDHFIVDQLAGDLYQQPTQDQLVASGFNRLHLIIDRGTALPEESFMRNVVDRVSSVGTAFLGLTLECAVCHDHKYDPITQQDFYQLYAFFNNFDGDPETGGRSGLDFQRGLQPPYLELPSSQQQQQRRELEKKLDELKSEMADAQATLDALGGAKSDASKSNPAGEAATPESSEVADRRRQATENVQRLKRELQRSEQARDALIQAIPATLVMKERSEPRPAHIMIRGNYDQPGQPVERNTPAFLPALKSDGGLKTRMDLARWLVDPSHPLTARVTVNRFWQQLFGIGLVKTSEDFGAQGETPSHPELLDYLSLRFLDSGWDVKELFRFIVLSKTYQQSSQADRERFVADRNNRLLARGSRYRLDAEVIRDQVLASCGLLNPTLYGKSVKPPQPAGLWEVVAMPSSYPNVYEADAGDKIYRRSVYSFWKRALPPPQMTIFDAPSRESCIARRERTNTPLQALVMMNEQQYFAAAVHFAKSLLGDPLLASDAQRIDRAYESITAQLPSPSTRYRLEQALQQFESMYQADPEAVRQVLASSPNAPALAKPAADANAPAGSSTRVDESTADDDALAASDVAASDVAAWAMLIHSLLNLDATRNRE